jgi:hypothetical protein
LDNQGVFGERLDGIAAVYWPFWNEEMGVYDMNNERCRYRKYSNGLGLSLSSWTYAWAMKSGNEFGAVDCFVYSLGRACRKK